MYFRSTSKIAALLWQLTLGGSAFLENDKELSILKVKLILSQLMEGI